MDIPIDNSDPQGTEYPIDVLGSCVPWFRAYLQSCGLRLSDNSALGRAIDTLMDFRARCTGTLSFDSERDGLAYLQEAFGADFLTKMLHIGHSSGFEIPRNRLTEILKADPIVTRPGPSSNERNRTWELVLACASASFADRTRFEEPDIVCSFQGREFFVPVKVVYSKSKLFERVKEGIDQAKHRPHGGVVFVDVVSILPIQKLFSLSARTKFASPTAAYEWIRTWSGIWHQELPLSRWVEAIQARTSRSIGVAFFLPLVLMVQEIPRSCWLVDMPIRSTLGPDYEFTTGIVQCFDGIIAHMP